MTIALAIAALWVFSELVAPYQPGSGELMYREDQDDRD